MAFNLQSFVGEPRTEEFNSLKKAELLQVAQHFKLTVNTSMGKGEIKKIVLNHLVEEELLPEEELENVNTREDHLELKKLEFQEREREVQLRLRELEIREKELVVEYKTKEIELHNAKSMGGPATNVGATFDVGKHIRFVPPFQETEVDKYFMHFEKIAASLKWPEDVWTVLLQSVLIGKAREIYSALPVDQSSNYLLVKEAMLKAYELVPEAYRQKFRKTTKEENQTYVEFARMKERLFDRWCTSQNVNGEYAKLRQLLLLEEFKNCLPSERINVVTKLLKKCLNAYNTGIDSSCHLSWEEAVNLSSQIYVDCLYSESTIPNSIKYQAVQFYQQLLRAEEEIVRIRNEMLNCVHHYIGAHECLVGQVECYKRSEDDQLGKICLLKKASAKCMNHLQSLQYFSKYTDINELQIFLLENKVTQDLHQKHVLVQTFVQKMKLLALATKVL